MKKKISLIIIILGIILFSCAIVGKTLQNDVFYSIRVGEKVLENGVDFKEYFSWHENLMYPYPHWLFTAIVGVFYKIAELDGVHIFKCIASSIFALVVFFMSYKRNKNYLLSGFTTLIIMFFCKGMLEARAQILSYPLLFLEWYFLEKLTEEKKMSYVIYLLIIPILIINLHIAIWPMTLVMYLPYIAEEILNFYKIEEVSKNSIRKKERLIKKAKTSKEKLSLEKDIKEIKKYLDEREVKEEKIEVNHIENIKLIIVLMFLTIFTGVVSPQGIDGYFHTLKLNISPTTSEIAEHQPLIVSSSISFMLITATLILFAVKDKIKFRARDLFFILGFGILALMSNRGIFFFAVVACIIMSKTVAEFLDIYGDIKLFENKPNILVTIIFMVIVIIFSGYFIYENSNQEYVPSSFYPVDAADFIIENLDYKNIRLYNSYNYGSYLLYRGIPNFVDSRQDLYCTEFNNGVDVLEDVFDITYSRANYKDIFEKYDITYAIVYKDTPEYWGLINDEEFEEIYSDDYYKVFERK